MKSCSYVIGVSVFKYNYFISTESKLVIFYYRIFIKVVLIASQEVEILEFDKDNFKIRAVGWVNILDYCRSESDSKGFSPGTPVFLPQQNWLPAYSLWLWCCAPRSRVGCVLRPSIYLAACFLWCDLDELCPLQFSLRLRERAISKPAR